MNAPGSQPSSPRIDHLADQRIEEAAKASGTIAELRDNVRKEVDALAYPHAPAVEGLREEERANLKTVLESKQEEMTEASQGFEAVRLENFSSPTQGGENFVGGDKSQAKVSRNLVQDSDKLEEVLIHEAHEEVGHSSQAAPIIANADAALVVDGEVQSVTAVLEGDVERGVQRELGKSATEHRGDQPEEDYGSGQRAANSVIEKIGEDRWNDALKNTGEYGALQKALWTNDLERQPDGATIARVMEEAQVTGYQEEAHEAIMAMAG